MKTSRRRDLPGWLATALLSISLLASPVGAQPAAPQTDEFQVNDTTASSQFLSDLAQQDDGTFVVVWMSQTTPGNDTSQYALVGQRFDASGVAVGDEFQVNSYTTGDQRWPAVTALDGGGFVVSWSSEGSAGTDTSGDSVQVRRFAADATPQGPEVQVNSTVTADQSYPSVDAAADGSFVVVWQSDSTMEDGSGYSVQLQRYDGAGNPVGGETVVNAYTTGDQDRPAVSVLDDGSFVVAWESNISPEDDLGSSVRARQFAADGMPASDELQVNTYTPGNQIGPAVGLQDAGGFVVVWESHDAPGDPASRSIQSRRFTADGTPRAADEQVNSFTTGPQTFPRLAVEGNGAFVVVWESYDSPFDDPSRSIQGQRLDPNGVATGDLFQVNQYTTNVQLLPAVAGRDGGDFVVSWITVGSVGDDTELSAIAGRLYGRDGDGDGVLDTVDVCQGNDASGDVDGDLVCADLDCDDGDGGLGLPDACGVCGGSAACVVFSDDFESGDTTIWSNSNP